MATNVLKYARGHIAGMLAQRAGLGDFHQELREATAKDSDGGADITYQEGGELIKELVNDIVEAYFPDDPQAKKLEQAVSVNLDLALGFIA